jgi:hypothetical protein
MADGHLYFLESYLLVEQLNFFVYATMTKKDERFKKRYESYGRVAWGRIGVSSI